MVVNVVVVMLYKCFRRLGCDCGRCYLQARVTAIAAERSQPFLIRHLDAPKGPSNTSFKVLFPWEEMLWGLEVGVESETAGDTTVPYAAMWLRPKIVQTCLTFPFRMYCD